MSTFTENCKTGLSKVGKVYKKIEQVIGLICLWIFRLRRFFMAIPVVYLALDLAKKNMERLPESVGLNMQSNGEFAAYVTREYAVMGPLGVTAFCILLMFCTRKTFFPWVISIFSLVLPWLVYLTNIYPA